MLFPQERSLISGPNEGTYWYGNMTMLFDAIDDVQRTFGDGLLQQLSAPTVRVISGISFSVIIIVSVIIVSPVVVFRVRNTLLIIADNINLCLKISGTISSARKHVEGLLVSRYRVDSSCKLFLSMYTFMTHGSGTFTLGTGVDLPWDNDVK